MRIVVAKGEPRERGRVIGRELAEEIHRSLGFYRRYFERRGFDRARVAENLRPLVAAAEDVLPHEVEAIRGTAEGADVSFLDLFAPNAFEELDPLMPEPADAPTRAAVERCTAFTVVAPGVTLLGHDEQWLAGDAGCAAVVIEITNGPDGTAIVSPTVATWRPAVGMNSRGGAQAVMSLTASDDGVGVPRVLVSRHALEASGREDAFRRTSITPRSGGYAYGYAFRGGDAFTVETSGTRAAIIDGPGGHTNHYLDPDLATVGHPPSPGSGGRLDRLRVLLEERTPATPQDVMGILADHGAGSQRICLHPDADDGEESDAVLFSMVCDLETPRMWVALGTPCTAPFDEVDLADVL
ncbi:MAG TPA: C45 family peptidase [Actinomycetota bacterium]|nr:C45 family peptidase [Actinomycetota bacterium]